METPAEDTQQPELPAADEADHARGNGPSGLRLAVTSIGVFLAIVAIGGVIGLASGAGIDDADALTVAEVSETEVGGVVEVLDEVPAQSAAPSTAPSTTTVVPIITTDNAATSDAAELTAADVTVSAPVVVVQGVTELALPLADTVDDETQATGRDATTVEFLELPKAVYDRFTLRAGDSFAINIAANDKIGGVLESVALTGIGELAPGFSLDQDGTVSGVADQCGNWKAQYALNSTNPAVGTSWIDITVSGCTNA